MKRIKKIVYILAIILLCSGCTLNYNLEIKENEIVEEIVANDNYMDGRNEEDILKSYNYWLPVYDNINNPDMVMDGDDAGEKIDGVQYHEKQITKKNDGYYYTYKYTYPIGEFGHANSIKLAFGKSTIYNGGSYLNLRTDSQNGLCNYDYFESLQVNIKVDSNKYKVEKTNAHRVNGNTYTWNLNRDNCSNSIIALTLNKINNNPSSSKVITTRKNEIVDRKSSQLDNYALYIFLGIVVLIVFLGYRWFNNMKGKHNEMDD